MAGGPESAVGRGLAGGGARRSHPAAALTTCRDGPSPMTKRGQVCPPDLAFLKSLCSQGRRGQSREALLAGRSSAQVRGSTAQPGKETQCFSV